MCDELIQTETHARIFSETVLFFITYTIHTSIAYDYLLNIIFISVYNIYVQ